MPQPRITVPGYDAFFPGFYDNAVLGRIPGVQRVAPVGQNPDIDTNTVPEDVWPVGGLTTVFELQTAVAMEAVSDSTDDTAAGDGARTIRITGLDSNYLPVVVDVALSGETPVPIPVPLMRINRGRVLTAGSERTNQGNIDIRAAGGEDIYASFPPLIGFASQAWYTVPAGHSLNIHMWIFRMFNSENPNDFAQFTSVMQFANVLEIIPSVFVVTNSNPTVTMNLTPPFLVGEKSDIILHVDSVGQNGTAVVAGFAGLQFDRTLFPNGQ
jgi:hypothetical protein